MRRPTQRYIEELSDKKSKHFKGEGKFSSVAAGMKDKRLKVRSHDELYPARLGMLSSVPEEELVSGTKVQAVSEIRARRGRPKKQISILVSILSILYFFLSTFYLHYFFNFLFFFLH